MPDIRNQKGMTLLELLLACLMTFIIGAAALEFYSSSHNQWLVQNDVSDMQQNARALLDELTTNIRSSGYGIVTGHPRIEVTPYTLTLYRKDAAKIDTINYYVDTTDAKHPNLMKRLNQDAAQVFAEDIESIQFARTGTLVTVTLVAREGRRDPEYSGDGYRRRTFVADVELRNGI